MYFYPSLHTETGAPDKRSSGKRGPPRKTGPVSKRTEARNKQRQRQQREQEEAEEVESDEEQEQQ